MSRATPIRDQGARTDEGWTLLRDVGLDYFDGAEDEMLALLRESRDVSATSAELVERAANWTQRYNVHPARANVVRALEIPEDAVVLEIGAGCGAVTRYLGERCRIVDALEPVAARARVARERTRDLDGVEVFVGMLEDVPAEPTYDVVVVVGVLEWSSGGTADREPYVTFLRRIRDLLTPGGSLVLAIENKLGVKYLAGAAEDHTGLPFDGVEGYPRRARARTFSRAELESMFVEAGLAPSTRVAFPDYKITRTVLDPDAFPYGASSLVHRIPEFPSPDWFGTSVPGPDEGLLWKSLAEAGLATESGNSFVVVATRGDAVSPLWPDDRAAIYFTPERRAAFDVVTDVRAHGDVVRLDRASDDRHRVVDGIRVAPTTAHYVPGRDFLEVFVDTQDARSCALLQQWATLVAETSDAAADEDGAPLDLVPHNLVVDETDTVRLIDDEWRATGMTATDLLRRGAVALALRQRQSRPTRGAWEGVETWRDVVVAIGEAVGLDGRDWVDETLTREARFQATVLLPAVGSDRESFEESLVSSYRDALDSTVAGAATEAVSVAAVTSLQQENAELRAFADHLGDDITALRGEIARLERNESELRDEILRLGGVNSELTAEYDHVFADLHALLPESARQVDRLRTVEQQLREAQDEARSAEARAARERADHAAAVDELAALLESRWWRSTALVRALQSARGGVPAIGPRTAALSAPEIRHVVAQAGNSLSWRLTHPGRRAR